MSAKPEPMLLIVRDRWVPEKYFDLSEREEAHKHLAYLQRTYRGRHGFEIRLVSADYPRRFDRATMGVTP